MRKAQSLLEYALLISVVVSAFVAMSMYMNRAVSANLKTMEDQVNDMPYEGSAAMGSFNSTGG